ncbi:hypothetical protein RQP46_005741 [Phenoliferia psychrophenolica]
MQGASPASAASSLEAQERTIQDYLERHGHHKALATFRAEIQESAQGAHTPGAGGAATPGAAGGATTPGAGAAGGQGQAGTGTPPLQGGGRATGLDDFADKNAPIAPKGPASAVAGPSSERRRLGNSVAGAQLLTDPPSWEKGYEGMRTFVENSLDIHRPELHPMLLPLFVHSYLDLVLINYRDAATQFLARFSADHEASDPHVVRMLSSIRLASHVAESEEATRWRQERYGVRLSERGWGLLLGWLQGGGLAGTIEGTEARGRDRMLAIINERVKVDALPGPPAKSATEYGLLSDFNRKPRALDELKLGPAPLDPKLQREVARLVKDEDGPVASTSSATPAALASSSSLPTSTSTDPVPTPQDSQLSTTLTAPSSSSLPTADSSTTTTNDSGGPPLVSPFPSELPPYPVSLRTIDVAREVEKVREARKRIKLGGEAFRASTSAVVGVGQPPNPTDAAKPSVCLFTIHDAGESLTTVAFSEDSTLMAAGFSESYIRLWNLKGGKLPGLRADFDSDTVTDAASLKAVRNKEGPTSRKLVGHSGPVYAVSFDPVPGPSGPPRYLLSCSQDTTVRLWSLESFTNVVAYRGHREPVWDVEWGPRGIYFATASRDRTARLWSSDKTSALRIFAGHLSDVNCVRFHPNSLYLATGSADRTCRLWDVQKGTCVRVFIGHRGSVSTLAISPDGRYLASASEDLTIILWDLASGRKIKSMTGHTSAVHSLSFSAESTVLVSGSSDATVRVWDVLAAPPAPEQPVGRKFEVGVAKRLSTAGLAGDGDGKGGLLPKSAFVERERESADLLATLATKRTPVLNVHFTPRNLCLAAGVGTDA